MIDVHHVDGDRDNNALDNLIPVCRSCHQKIHGRAEGYEDWHDKLNRSGAPAFMYNEAKQSPMYARPDAWDAYEDAMELEVERQLRDLDIRNIQKRELNEAMLLVAAENPDLVFEKALELRREG